MNDVGINDSHLDQIEHLLAQSMNGIHLLFENETIRQILKKPTEEMELFHQRNLNRIQELFTELIHRDSLIDKQIYLQSLDPESYELLLRTYFHIVDNSVLQAGSEPH